MPYEQLEITESDLDLAIRKTHRVRSRHNSHTCVVSVAAQRHFNSDDIRSAGETLYDGPIGDFEVGRIYTVPDSQSIIKDFDEERYDDIRVRLPLTLDLVPIPSENS